MTLKLHNTLTRKTETFAPLTSDKVTLYTCGPTVYDHLHVGNWAAYIYWDTLVRTLIASGYRVERVMNITDVGHLVSDADDGEDKLEKGARREKKTAWEVAEYYAEDFVAGMEKLGLIPPEHLVRATDFIPQQLNLVRVLKEKGYTWENVIAFGDAGNDIPFIQKAGIGVALGNAKDDVRQYADIIADTCANDGVAKVLEELGIA